MRGVTKLGAWIAFDALAMLALVTGCNAVFGLDDVSFGSGGGGGAGGDASQGPASTTSETASTGGSACAADLVNEGEFDDGWDLFWSLDMMSAETEIFDDQPVLHVTVDDGAASGGTLTNSLDGDDICLGACLSSRFSFGAARSFVLNVLVEDDDGAGATARVVLLSESVDASASLEQVVTTPCRVPLTFTSPDRLSFVPSEGGEFLLDDVELLVDECTGDVDDCAEI